MDSVVLRIVADDRLKTAAAAFQVERTRDYTVLALPVGSPGFTRHGVTGGPRDSFLLPDHWEPGFHPRPWRHHDVVIVHRFAEEWSTWRWLDESGSWTAGSYVNLERKWTIGPGWYETDDLTLDVVVDAGGGIQLKDEDELDWAEGQGFYTAAEAARIRRIGQRAMQHVGTGGWPCSIDWDRWRWPAGLGLPQLPDDWENVG